MPSTEVISLTLPVIVAWLEREFRGSDVSASGLAEWIRAEEKEGRMEFRVKGGGDAEDSGDTGKGPEEAVTAASGALTVS